MTYEYLETKTELVLTITKDEARMLLRMLACDVPANRVAAERFQDELMDVLEDFNE